MEICGFPGQLPAINRRFNLTQPPSSLITATYSLCQSAKMSAKPLIGGEMFVLGMGFVGQYFAADLKNKGWVVSGSCTSIAKKQKLQELEGYQAFLFDANDPQSDVLEVVGNHTHLVVSIPPTVGLGDPVLRHRERVESILKGGRLRWLVYLSSTSVYGDCGGAWVDENYAAKPASENAKARLAAEEEWLSLGRNLGISAQVFRLGGIYGPGRSAVDTILKQEPLSTGQRSRLSKTYTSRVHVADICQALHASILNPSSGKIYNIVDDDPAPRREVFKFAHRLVGEEFPQRDELSIAPEEAETIVAEEERKGEKRVSNGRMKNELGVELIHPSYRSGLSSIMEQINTI